LAPKRKIFSRELANHLYLREGEEKEKEKEGKSNMEEREREREVDFWTPI